MQQTLSETSKHEQPQDVVDQVDAIVMLEERSIDDNGKVTNFYPAHCKFRGFDNDNASKAYVKITKHLEKRLPELLKDIEA